MKIFNLYITVIALLLLQEATAQQDPNFSFYRFNMNIVNPAYAGTSDETEIGLNLRSQWANVEGAPETQSFFVSTGVSENLGVGISIISDKTFIESQTALAADFSYKVKMNKHNNLYFGLKAGFNSYDVNTASLMANQIQTDASLTNIDGRFNPNIGAGVYLKNDTYYISFSIPKLLSSDRVASRDGTARLTNDKTHVYLSGGFDKIISNSFTFKPSVMVRYINASPLSLDFTALFNYKKLFELGPTYRINESIGGVFLVKGLEWLNIGYAYESTIAKAIGNFDNGTHEIMFNIKF